MVYPKAYIEFLVHFHGDRDYFECHEVLEYYWKKTDAGNRSSIWVGFIQLAVALYHQRRGNMKGAKKLIKKSIDILKQKKTEINKLGINPDRLFSLLDCSNKNISNGHEYYRINLPIYDSRLLHVCQNECAKLGFNWCDQEDLKNDYIVHHHLLRDRTTT